MAKTGSKDRGAIKNMLKSQRAGVLQKVKEAKVEMKRKKTAEEQKNLDRVREHVKAIGLCVASYSVITSSFVFLLFMQY